MKIDRRDFIKYSVLGMSAAALLGPAQKGDPNRIFIWHNRTGGYETGQDGRIDTSRWNDEKFYSTYPKEKMVEAILKGKVTVNGKEVNTVEALMALGEPTLVIERAGAWWVTLRSRWPGCLRLGKSRGGTIC